MTKITNLLKYHSTDYICWSQDGMYSSHWFIGLYSEGLSPRLSHWLPSPKLSKVCIHAVSQPVWKPSTLLSCIHVLRLLLHLLLPRSSFAFMSAWGWTTFFSVLCKFEIDFLVLDALILSCEETECFEVFKLCDLRIFFPAYCSESESPMHLFETSSVGSLKFLTSGLFACEVLCFFGRVPSKVFLRNCLLVVTFRFCLKENTKKESKWQ